MLEGHTCCGKKEKAGNNGNSGGGKAGCVIEYGGQRKLY